MKSNTYPQPSPHGGALLKYRKSPYWRVPARSVRHILPHTRLGEPSVETILHWHTRSSFVGKPRVGCLKSILEHRGYEVLLASNGADGISLARGRKGNLVLGYGMPLMMGTEVAQRLRDMQPALPIIIVSGIDLPEEAARVAD